MRKLSVLLVAFVLAFTAGIIWSSVTADQVEAKPMICKLAVEPFLYCEPSNRCHGPGEEYCWQCQGIDQNGNPCLCSRVGCLVP